ncbi:MAG: VWA domain-containing protein [Victivallales bacterium]|nr:VWA domain-containing protein [Victivallales bacterium]
MFLLPFILAFVLWLWRPVPKVSTTHFLKGKRPSPFSRHELPRWLLATAASLAILSVENHTVTYTSRMPRPTVTSIAILLDMSGSMEASDWTAGSAPPEPLSPDIIPPSRIHVAKEQIRRLLADCPNCRTALLAFAQNTVLIAPLSNSTHFLLERLELIQTEHFTDGTSIGQALLAAINSLKHAPEDGPHAIVLLSDGVDHSQAEQSSPENATNAAIEAGIAIYAIGIGGEHALHPVTTDNGIRWKEVGEPLDIKQLTDIAEKSGGKVFKAQDGTALAAAINAIGSQIKQRNNEFTVHRALNLSPWFMLTAILAIIGYGIARYRSRI